MSVKKLFKYIQSKDYTIIKDDINKDILYIHLNDKKMKCKYISLFIHKNNKLIFYDKNPYIDQKTVLLSRYLKDIFIQMYDLNNINKDNITEIITKIMSLKFESTKCEWIIQNKLVTYTEYYMITDIIYF